MLLATDGKVFLHFVQGLRRAHYRDRIFYTGCVKSSGAPENFFRALYLRKREIKSQMRNKRKVKEAQVDFFLLLIIKFLPKTTKITVQFLMLDQSESVKLKKSCKWKFPYTADYKNKHLEC